MYSNKNLIEYVGNQNSYLLLTTANNNKAHRCLWNHSTTSGNPSGMYLVEVDGNQAQNGTPHGMSQSECTQGLRRHTHTELDWELDELELQEILFFN